MAIWDDTESLGRIARIAPYLFIVFGFLVALTGQYVRSTLDTRISSLNSQREREHRETAPSIDAFLATSAATGELLVVLDARNLIPFRTSWTIVTTENKIVSGVMLEGREIHPTPEKSQFTGKANVDRSKVVNNYVELRLSYQSVYAAELGNPPALSGRIVRKFWLGDDGVKAWTEPQSVGTKSGE